MKPQPERQKKKKPDLARKEEEIPYPSKSEIIRESSEHPAAFRQVQTERQEAKHTPVIEKQTRSFSIRELMEEDKKDDNLPAVGKSEEIIPEVKPQDAGAKEALTAGSLDKAWKEFTDSLKGEGARVLSMFKSAVTELDEQEGVSIRLSNAAQKDLFVLNYKTRLTAFLQKKFRMEGIGISATVDSSETNEILYSDEQKFNHMLSKYPVLKDFKKTFNLDLP